VHVSGAYIANADDESKCPAAEGPVGHISQHRCHSGRGAGRRELQTHRTRRGNLDLASDWNGAHAITDDAGIFNTDQLPTPAEYVVTLYYGTTRVERVVQTRTGDPTIVSPRIASRDHESYDSSLPPRSIRQLIKIPPDGAGM